MQQVSPLSPSSVSPVHTNIPKPKPETPNPSIHTEQIQHQLKLKASTVGSVKKATGVLALGMFSAEERMSCTITGLGMEKKNLTKIELVVFQVGYVGVIKYYTRKNAQVVTSLQTSCNKSVHKLSTSCVRTSALTTNFHILVSRGGGWLGISRTIKF